MKLFRIAMAFTLVILVAPASAEQKDPKPYSSKDGKFTINFPEAPKEMKQELSGQKFSIWSVDQKEKAYVVMFNELPAAVEADKSDAVFDAGRDQAVKSMKGKLADDKKLSLGKKYVGREVLISSDALWFRDRMYIVGTRFYQVIVTGPEEFVKSKEVTAVMDSFKITD
ncbi:MAG: hypothetical protein K2R98_23180 [Gemmataceae bacterium]|nr:hypothetical protein [Gemmataceae bacterium]